MTTSSNDEEAGHRAYYRLPQQGWDQVLPALRDQLLALRARLDAIVAAGGPAPDAPSPADFALQLGELATATFELLSPEEHALRQVITTLRTGLALCWDMYGPIEAGRVSVRDHMDRLKAEIGSFEADLRLLQTELERPGEAGPPAPSGSVP